MTKKSQRCIVFSDLDGTLLNQDDYSYEEAKPALELMERKGIPLVICTSKTRREVEAIQAEMHMQGPFIVENGGAIFFPADYEGFTIKDAVIMHGYKCIPLGVPYARIRAFMHEVKDEFALRGFGDMSSAEIAEYCGLPLDKAEMAKMREFTEPFIIPHERRIWEIVRLAKDAGLKITRGGRFFHIVGEQNDKGLAVKYAKAVYANNWQAALTTIGLGDSPNDFPMLALVDIPVLIPHPDGRHENIILPGLNLAKYPGSKGWNQVLIGILKRIGASHKDLAGKIHHSHGNETR